LRFGGVIGAKAFLSAPTEGPEEVADDDDGVVLVTVGGALTGAGVLGEPSLASAATPAGFKTLFWPPLIEFLCPLGLVDEEDEELGLIGE
jgi:hypothetical protein